MRALMAEVGAVFDVEIEALKHSLLPRHVGARRAYIYILRLRGCSYGEIARALCMVSKSAVRRLFLQAQANPDSRINHLL